MRGKHPLGTRLPRAASTALAVTAVLAPPWIGAPSHPWASVAPEITLLNSTLLAMGGNDNPSGLTPDLQQELGGDPRHPGTASGPRMPAGTRGLGYLDTDGNPASPYYGWDFERVSWPADIGLSALGGWPYEQSQRQGVDNIDRVISATMPDLAAGERIVAFGYSSSANVLVREMRELMNRPGGGPPADQLEFFLMGNPSRPNGGIAQRFAGAYIPLVDIKLDGSTPVDTPYRTTDISWQYDMISDFPLYPANLLADLNSLVAWQTLHGNYFPADMNGPRAFPDTTVGNITYVTLKPPHLPLLIPLYDAGFPEPLLDSIEPALTTMVDSAYDRSISPGAATTARLMPSGRAAHPSATARSAVIKESSRTVRASRG